MKIIIAGCGKIGSTILASLAGEGHDVTALDRDADVIGEVTNIYDAIGVVGNGADCETLSEAGIDSTDLFVAVMNSDEINMLACFIARRMGAKHTIARIRNPEYNDNSLDFMRRELGLSMAINPEQLAAEELYNMLRLPSAVKVEKFSGQNLEMIELRLREDSPLSGMRLSDMRGRYKAKILVCFVRRGEDVFIPDGNFVLQCGDKIGLTATHGEIARLIKELGLLRKQAKSVIILGGSRTAFYLAKRLSDTAINVKIIEQNESHCNELSELLKNTVIIHGDGSNPELLLEERLSSADAFVALTGMDEQNILISIFASSRGVPKVITKINRNEMETMAGNLGLESVVSPRRIISDILVSYARALENSRGNHIETLYNLADDKAEALEFIVSPDAQSLIGIPLKTLDIKRGILIAGIMRGRTPIIPTGEDVILAGDRVVVIAAQQRLSDLSDILK